MTLNITSKLVLAFITLIIGVVLLGVISTQGLTVADKTQVETAEENAILANAAFLGSVNETEVYTLANVPTWGEDCPVANLAITNDTGGQVLTATTDYIPNLGAGTFTLVNNSDT